MSCDSDNLFWPKNWETLVRLVQGSFLEALLWRKVGFQNLYPSDRRNLDRWEKITGLGPVIYGQYPQIWHQKPVITPKHGVWLHLGLRVFAHHCKAYSGVVMFFSCKIFSYHVVGTPSCIQIPYVPWLWSECGLYLNGPLFLALRLNFYISREKWHSVLVLFGLLVNQLSECLPRSIFPGENI